MNIPVCYKQLGDLVVFQTLKVGPVILDKNRLSVPYILTLSDESSETNTLIYSYEEDVFDPADPSSQNLASILGVQVAVNYGLFCEKIVFEGLFDETDKKLILDMMENTSREIYVNRILKENVFLTKEYLHFNTEKKYRYTAAEIIFKGTKGQPANFPWKPWQMDESRHCILSSGGKDSLLTYGLLKELNKDTYPVFINESGRHWFTALNAYRYLKNQEKNTGKVWSNSDRIFNWMLRRMPFIRQDFNTIRSDEYPVRLWTVAVFIFGVLPVARKRKIGRILIGNEYDCTRRLTYKGISHYDGLYDQSKYFDNALTRYYLKKGWNISQFSVLRSLSELLILKILTKRYPDLHMHQVSCHASHEKNGRIFPCGKCEKCRRIISMLKVLDEDPTKCGYNIKQIETSLSNLSVLKVKQLGTDAAHLFHLLIEKNLISRDEHASKLAKNNPFIMKLRFDKERSVLKEIPEDLRFQLLRILLTYADGAVTWSHKKWMDYQELHA